MPDYSSANRETWLLSAVDVLRDAVFKPHGEIIPEIRVSVGLPHARNQRDILCQHFADSLTADKIPQVFVSPLLSDGPAVLAQLHNCLHKAYARNLHDKAPFGKKQIAMIMEVLGEYPQAALSLPNVPKQDTRMLKMVCKKCGYTARATRKWLTAYGAVLCPCNSKVMSCPEFN